MNGETPLEFSFHLIIFLIVVSIFLYIYIQAPKDLKRLDEELDAKIKEDDKRILFEYTFYSGFLIYFTQNTKVLQSKKEDLDENLKRCFMYNIKWALLSPGCIFIPLLSIANNSRVRKKFR